METIGILVSVFILFPDLFYIYVQFVKRSEFNTQEVSNFCLFLYLRNRNVSSLRILTLTTIKSFSGFPLTTLKLKS